jgi:hypothetical protein
MRALPFHVPVAALAAASLFAAARPAQACGGCFSPPRQVTVVTDHRMAFSVSQEQTVLWDQIEYSGQPQDFAWVLPVQPGAQVQLSHDAFFAALDAMSDPVITGPSPQCGGRGDLGCASFASGAANSADFAAGGVDVVSQSVIGPYDTVTLHATDSDALYDWLVANDYDIPDAIRPVIDAYVAGGFDFIALRLAPGQGVQAMQPVRVVSPGAGLTLPLRMVAAGVGDQVGITLYVIGEGRYESQNFPNAIFDDSKLRWLHAQGISNYEPLAEQIMQAADGRTWLTEFSASSSLVGEPSCGIGSTYSGVSDPTLAGLYFSQCSCVTSTPSFDAGPDGPLDAAGPEDAGPDGPLDAAGPEAGAADAATVDAETADTADADAAGPVLPANACTSYDDLQVALVGMDPSTTWVTRMRAILPANALSEGDLVLAASATQTAVSNLHSASIDDDPTYDPCAGGGGSGGSGCSTTRDEPGTMGRWLAVGSLAFAGLALMRRRRRAR